MPILDYSSYDPTKALRGTAKCTDPGKCELEITSANYKEGGKKGPYYAVNFEVKAHENPAAVGQEYFQIIGMSGEQSKTAMQIALSCGLVTMEQLMESKLGGKGGIDVDLKDAIGKIVYGDIKKGSFDGKDTYRVWDFWGPSDPESKSFPKSSDDDGSALVVDHGTGDDDDEEDDVPF